MNKLTLFLIFGTLYSGKVRCDVSDVAKELATKWAPLVWLHPEEKFFPVTPEFFIDNMEVKKRGNNASFEPISIVFKL